jgi:hypothetical protein
VARRGDAFAGMERAGVLVGQYWGIESVYVALGAPGLVAVVFVGLLGVGQMRGTPAFSVRHFLKQREALLVHFNTPMSQKHPTGFPNDLRHAMNLLGIPISFSTIQVGDLGPCQVPNPAASNAGGSVGLVVDIHDIGSVITVGPGDDGTQASATGNHQSGGSVPDPLTCAASIDNRVTANEWFVQNYTPLGIFVFLPAMVFVKSPVGQGERSTNMQEILSEYPNQRVFAASSDSFHEYDRSQGHWLSIAYNSIVP